MLLINSLTPCWSTRRGEHPVFMATAGIWREEEENGTRPPDVLSGTSHHSPPNLPVHPLVHHHLERMPGTGLVAELDSRARSAARLEKKILEGKSLFAVHACLSCVLALWCWTAACSADVGCPASQQDNISLIWHPKHAHKKPSPWPWISHSLQRGISLGCIVSELHLRSMQRSVIFASFVLSPPSFAVNSKQLRSNLC